ncbi:MAG TPA: FAD-dependent monooxygenase [Micromonosporaceae bacterium]|nr:FAD-dependent monooxygenase [Micromonosporaceae bacterium]
MLDVLVVGAGPTGLTLGLQLRRFGARVRVVDRLPDRVNQSRAVVLQPRSLEVLAGSGVAEEMLECGNRAVRLDIHGRRDRVRSAPLFDIGVGDSAYPFLLFLSQAETERILTERLAAGGVRVERGTELVGFDAGGDDAGGDVASGDDAGGDVAGEGAVACRLRHADGRVEEVSARFLVGCDGAHSAVRSGAGVEFVGRAYPQAFVLADVEADGLEPGAVHMFMTLRGILFFFPLGTPATWRMLSMRPEARTGPGTAGPGTAGSGTAGSAAGGGAAGGVSDGSLTLAEAQAIVDSHATRRVRLHDPVWLSTFRLHCRRAERYRVGRVFLAGDAAHIHSPAGGQGMNVGIQDSVNLGWKLAMACAGVASPAILDSYEVEREPVGREVLRFTDRAFAAATSTNPVVRLVRATVVPRVLPVLLSARPVRATAFRAVSELGVSYRDSPLSADAAGAGRDGPKAGDRLPDGPVLQDGAPSTLHAALAAPGWHELVASPGQLHIRSLWPDRTRPVGLQDPDGQVSGRLGLAPQREVRYLLRPDGHIGYRGPATDDAAAAAYLRTWLPGYRNDRGTAELTR